MARPDRFPAAHLLSIALLALIAAGCARPAASPADATHVAVSAAAEVRKAPDIAILSTGVVTQAADARSAIRLNSQRMEAVVAALGQAGIASKDVQTSGVSLNPDYHYVANRPPRIRGYHASNTINVTVRDIARLGQTLDALVAVGANQVHGPLFDIADRDAVLDEARGKALAKARARADLYARRLGLRVARVVSVDETGGRGLVPAPMAVRGMAVAQDASANASLPISPGENTLGLSLDVVYALTK